MDAAEIRAHVRSAVLLWRRIWNDKWQLEQREVKESDLNTPRAWELHLGKHMIRPERARAFMHHHAEMMPGSKQVRGWTGPGSVASRDGQVWRQPVVTGALLPVWWLLLCHHQELLDPRRCPHVAHLSHLNEYRPSRFAGDVKYFRDPERKSEKWWLITPSSTSP